MKPDEMPAGFEWPTEEGLNCPQAIPAGCSADARAYELVRQAQVASEDPSGLKHVMPAVYRLQFPANQEEAGRLFRIALGRRGERMLLERMPE